jgi:hypothetical protein
VDMMRTDSTDWAVQARSRLARRRAEKPATKAAQIRALWPDIEAALAVGQSVRTVCAWLAEDAGISLSATSLTSYVSRIRRREKAQRHVERSIDPSQPLSGSTWVPPHSRAPLVSTQVSILASREPRTPSELNGIQRDPLANFHASDAKRPGFNYRPATAEDEEKLF